jgi:shikimate dehydrogenase
MITQPSGATRLVPILAHPVQHVRAPALYNPAFAAAGLDWHQVPMGVHPDDLAATLEQLARLSNLQGLNLTIPHKAAAWAICNRLGPEARRTDVVNTMRLQPDGNWAGESFDGTGFVEAARAHGMLRPERPVMIVGTGGAGTAIAFALAAAGVQEFFLVNRDAGRAIELSASLQARYGAIRCHIGNDGPADAGLVVNATSLGLHAGDALPLDVSPLAADACVFDIVAARDTELMAAAQARGLKTTGGRPMIEHQIAAQIGFWRGDAIELEHSA